MHQRRPVPACFQSTSGSGRVPGGTCSHPSSAAKLASALHAEPNSSSSSAGISPRGASPGCGSLSMPGDAQTVVLGSEAGALKLRVFCWGALLVYIALLCSIATNPPGNGQPWTQHPVMLRAAGMAGISASFVHKLCFLQRFGFFSTPKGQPPMSPAQLADHVLLLAASGAPALNLIMYFTAPAFSIVTTNWPLVIVFHTLIAVFAMGLPPMHALLQLGCSCLTFGCVVRLVLQHFQNDMRHCMPTHTQVSRSLSQIFTHTHLANTSFTTLTVQVPRLSEGLPPCCRLTRTVRHLCL